MAVNKSRKRASKRAGKRATAPTINPQPVVRPIVPGGHKETVGIDRCPVEEESLLCGQEEGYRTLYGFLNGLLKASLQSKAKWLKTWPTADSPAPLGENVAFILPKAMRRAAAAEQYNEDGLDNEDVALPDVNDGPDDNGLFDALLPPDADIAEVLATVNDTKTAVDEIREDVNRNRQAVNSSNQVMAPASNQMEAAAGTMKNEATSLADAKNSLNESLEHAKQTLYDAEDKMRRAQADTEWARQQELKACEEQNRVLRAHRDHLDHSLLNYINDEDYTEKLAAFVQDRDKLEAMVEQRDAKILEIKAELEEVQKRKSVLEAAERKRAEDAERRKRKREAATGGASKRRQCGA
ncbi:hypothetical protein FN846DRAFT_911429 [Sphaerosporella brunnea]|uniref:Uncharacterized protein n=1 Tax=Sphaerosporella brunnea TaxID=1250544 RepID=A0A5J5EKK8_9PEZI|nr:hypothetical protein FN846DRAFT_911429 [Sphaerosporella brunnea]